MREVESYRLEHGVKDTGHTFGRQPKDGAERAERRAAERRLAETQRRLGLERQLALREQTRSIERDFGIGL